MKSDERYPAPLNCLVIFFMKKQREYIIKRPIRGVQSLLVIARSKKEAMEKVDGWDHSDDVQGLDFDVSHYGKAYVGLVGNEV